MKVFKNVFLFISILMIVYSCENPHDINEKHDSILTLAIEGKPSTYVPYEITDFYSSTVIGQMVEGLVTLNPKTLKVEPQLASSWKIYDENKTYEFILRDDVRFHESDLFEKDEDRDFTSKDIFFTITEICKPRKNNLPTFAYQFLLKNNVIGAKEFHENQVDSISGIEMTDSSFIFRLIEEDANFLNKLTHVSLSIISSKIPLSEYHNLIVGTGPFQFGNSNDEQIELIRNKEYYEKDDEGFKLPYLAKLNFIIQRNNENQIQDFIDNKTDLIFDVKKDDFRKFIDKYQSRFNTNPVEYEFINNQMLGVNLIGFNTNKGIFKNLDVRQAFNYAIDKNQMKQKSKHVYNSKNISSGIIPCIENFNTTYDYERTNAYKYVYDVAKAKKIMNNYKDLDTMTLKLICNSSNVEDGSLLLFIKQIKDNLGIKIVLEKLPIHDFLNKLYASEYDLIYFTLLADYYNPESLLQYFYGKSLPTETSKVSYQNILKYSNPLFDFYYEQAKKTKKEAIQNANFINAEMILLKDAPFIIISNPGNYQIKKAFVKDYTYNSINYFQAKRMYVTK